MKSIIVFDGIQLIALAVGFICLMILGFALLLDRQYRKHPHGRFKKFWYKVFGVDKDLW